MTTNPFGLTKSADMPDSLIHQLWVDVKVFDIESKIKSLNPVFLIGGKGSGKTHIFRHYSYPLQKIRFRQKSLSKMDGIYRDGYIGIYYRCKGLQADRFSGKGYSEEQWQEFFKYALELTLGHELIFILSDLIEDQIISHNIGAEIAKLLDMEAESLQDLEQAISMKRRKLYQAISNSALGHNLKDNPDAKILISGGDLIYEIPKIIKKHIKDFDFPCIYLIDEIENFGANHQKYLNTLIREKEPEVSIKIGARKYGIRTDITLSAGEALMEGSEKETFILDDLYRLANNRGDYRDFLINLLSNRIEQNQSINVSADKIERLFQKYTPSWNDQRIKKLVEESKKRERIHFRNIRGRLDGLPKKEIDLIIGLLKFDEFPVLEKVNIFNYYKQANSKDYITIAHEIKNDCQNFILSDGKNDGMTSKAYGHYKNNLIFQLRAEYRDKEFYNGIDDIIDMSEGMPRNFLQILKRIYDWSTQLERNPFANNKTSDFDLEIQRKAIRESSEWFFDDVRECEDRANLKDAIERLGQLLRINHFADKPKECSCISFAVEIGKLSKEARQMIEVAENYSFLIALEEAHVDKNHSSNLLRKYQINKMLCPLWDLPLARRGTKQLNSEEAELIFNVKKNKFDDFLSLRNRWESETKFSLKSKPNEEREPDQGTLL